MNWNTLPSIQDDELPIGLDFDKTIAHNTGHPYYIPTTPIDGAQDFVRTLVERGEIVEIHTSRPDADKHKIEAWMKHYEFPPCPVSCGKRLFKKYIDDKAITFKGSFEDVLQQL